MKVKTKFTALEKDYEFVLDTENLTRNYEDEWYAYWVEESDDGRVFEINIEKEDGKFVLEGDVVCFYDQGDFEDDNPFNWIGITFTEVK